ncbi:MAG TPA: ATPase [Erysipelotrichaceae bacterium]|nr:ATPase [Erysipelotrichaceae bacterium]
MKNWYEMNHQEVLETLHTRHDGLNEEEVEKIRAEKGSNKLEETKLKTPFAIFLSQFADLLVIILIIAASVSLFTGDVESTLVIVTVLILNAILGTVQSVNAQKSLAALKSLSSPHVKVIRHGQRLEIDSVDVVPGDIVMLDAGDMICADGRILESFSLQVNESSLTGESTNVEKKDEVLQGEVALADRTNMVFSGSLVTYGRAIVVVTETGMHTEIGKIAQLMNDTKEHKTPLQKSLDDFSGKLATGIMIISVIVFGLEMWRGMHIMDALLFAVALAVAAIPEALSSIVTIVQAMGTKKMAKENAIIKDLAAVESLGSVSVICSDKTGTLTQNKMTVQDIYIGGELLKEEDLKLTNQLHRYLLLDAILANDSTIANGVGIGDPTEYALIEMFYHVKGISINHGESILTDHMLRDTLPRIQELSFDSDRKLMSTKHIVHGIPTIFTKGAIDVLLERCTKIRDNNGIRPITEEDKKAIMKQNDAFSKNGLRVLAFAYKESDEELTLETENNYIFIGLISMIDPPRVESIQAVKDAKEAGIRTVMITGDHKVTATAIAKKIGIFNEGDEAVTGMELDAMSDEELARRVEHISVYARVSPENKIRIVDAWQKKGRIVSMTGDGVNDAPALKKADIGVAMGITGTEVSKDAASMILSDDNFATIIKAVANGRVVYKNIKNAVLYLLSGNLSAILVVLYTSVVGLPIPFLAVQLLFINLVTDSLPALAIGMEPGDHDVLKQKPRDPHAGIMDKAFIRRMVLQGILIGIVVAIAFHIGLKTSSLHACSMAFLTLTMSRLLHGFNCRDQKSIFALGFKRNMFSLYAFLIGLVLVLLIIFTPVGRSMFRVAAMNGTQVTTIFLLAIIPTAIIQLRKIISKHN